MNRQKKRTIILISAGIVILLIGTLAGYLVTHSRYTTELDRKTKEIESLQQSIAEQKKENEDLQADILEAMETITDLEEQAVNAEPSKNEESKVTADKNENETKDENTSAEASPDKVDSAGETESEQTAEQDPDTQLNEVTSSEATEAIKLVKEHVSYANEPNVHFDIEGNVPGSSDICIHVYEIVDDGESQHTATWGWYGVNLNAQSVYDTEGL